MDQRENQNRRPPEGGVRINRVAPPGSVKELDSERGELPVEKQSPPKRSSNKGPWVLVITILIVLGVLGYVFRDKLTKISRDTSLSNFQAVFLTNGQVYFGRLSDSGGGRYVTLEHIYYLQVTPVLQTKTEGQPGTQASAQQQQMSLVKLGSELHGPEDEMRINRDQILFIENLKEDGRVVQTIKDYEAGNQK